MITSEWGGTKGGRNQSGKISRNELKNVLNALNIQVSDNELKQIMSQIDGDIESDKFCRVMGQTYFKKYTREELQDTFRKFDSDGSGYIQARELKTIMSGLGKRMKQNEIDQMIKSLDTTGDGQIRFDEFGQIM
ncbi:unnamed protein product [Didymodactylos carnosus]|uniref:EF-hand domain-containing protein n=1 Tax=Didymodactylos carnosus TaxID=1234261 RepID=A0A814IQN4_9BILA|nr:unnamed protein product [Didymodactylos carnosus]CAF3798481.1 unnamed protein product [Didymodactylos carnosus]